MNEDHHLILIKGQDKTEEIDFCKYENSKWHIRFRNNARVYSYNYENVKKFKDPKIIDPNTNIIYERNLPITGVIKILRFGEYIKLVFKTGYKKIWKHPNVIVEETFLKNRSARSTFEYLKTIANSVSIKLDHDESFLKKQYNSLTLISPRSVLSAYLEGSLSVRKNSQPIQAIFPFGFNISQKGAAERALNNQISIIEGPPGTGKTQTILNIIANAIMNDKTVAVVSNNNSATANVLEKLEKYGVDFFTAYLGNKENKARFFANQKETYPSLSEWVISHSEYQSLKEELKRSQHKLNEMLEYQNKRALLKQELSIIQTEAEYFYQYYRATGYPSLELKSFSKFSSEKILKILLEYKQSLSKGKMTLKDKLYYLFFHGIYNLKLYKLPSEQLVSYIQRTYYEKKIIEIANQIDTISTRLEDFNFENEMKEYSGKSMVLFKAKLTEKYGPVKSRPVFTQDALWKEREFGSFIKEYPVILSTTHSLRNSAPKNFLFDYVIIDEASQVDIVTGALALSCAKNAVIVGDVRQLPNVVPSNIEMITERIFDSFDLVDAYQYGKHSLLSSLLEMFSGISKTLLREHYRCHPKIIGFCNQKFYHNELVILTEEEEKDNPLTLYKTTKGNHARGKYNQRQIDVIFNEIIPRELMGEDKSIGIISPYRSQANELQKAISRTNMDADTVHKYQGRERDVIILSTVANSVSVNDFVDDPNLINVAVSRAVNKLVVVVSGRSEEWSGTNIGDLVRYIQYNNFEIIESEIYSVFDLLYSSYSDKLLDMMKKTKWVSTFKSENLMNAVIEHILMEPEFSSLNRVLHQPLRMLIKDLTKLTDEERNYATNILTHTDFVIFNKLDKMPVLVVEVDGHAYHANNPAQLRRDKLKDTILEKYGIPILRLKTTGSNEEPRLRNKLLELLKGDKISTENTI